MPREDLALNLEVDVNDKIFEDVEERRELHRQASQLSPRRFSTEASSPDRRFDMSPLKSPNGSVMTKTLPFYEDITPMQAVEQVFEWFHQPSLLERANANGGFGDDEEGKEPAITLDEFNALRRCLGKSQITPTQWKRAVEELGLEPVETAPIPKSSFKVLFGPAPYFGSKTVQGIVQEVIKTEEYLHFAMMLHDRHAEYPMNGEGGHEKLMGLKQFQDIQRACCAEDVYTQAEWDEMCKKLHLAPNSSLKWKEFAEAFTVSIKNKKPFAPHLDPSAVTYAVLANEKVLSTIRNGDEDIVSRKTLTNLLRVQKEKVDDEVWMKLLQNMQTEYKLRQGQNSKLSRKNSTIENATNAIEEANSVADAIAGVEEPRNVPPLSQKEEEEPMLVIRNTRNQVLSYEILFDEHGDIGIELQPDFFGQCMTVKEIAGQAAQHNIIKKHDIVAAINGRNLTYKELARNKDEEIQRLEKAKQMLKGDDNKIRKITFYRQETYFEYNTASNGLNVYLKTFAKVYPMDKIVINVPQRLNWSPNPQKELRVDFRLPSDPSLSHPELTASSIVWEPTMQVLEISLSEGVGIDADSTIVLCISGMNCGSKMLVGPCEMSEEIVKEPVQDPYEPDRVDIITRKNWNVSLYDDWEFRESTIRQSPLRERTSSTTESVVDKSLTPLCKYFEPGDSGISLGLDFFGQCLVVEKVKEVSHADKLGVKKHDILFSVTVLGENGDNSLNQTNCIKPFALSKKEAQSHLQQVNKILKKCHKSGRKYMLEFLRLNSHFYHESGRTIFNFHAARDMGPKSSLVVKMPTPQWRLDGIPSARVLEPEGLIIHETYWDSQRHCLHMVFDEKSESILKSTAVTVEFSGVVSPSGANIAGPGELTAKRKGKASEFEYELHEHWHSFIVGHQGIATTKVAETLKAFKTSPAVLWEVLEYTSQLYNMFVPHGSEYIKIEDCNRLVSIVCGSNKKLSNADWAQLCRHLGAKPLVGLTRQQFACCWNDVVGLSSLNAKDVYVRLHTAERLFKELIEVFDDEDDDSSTISINTIPRLGKILGFSDSVRAKLLSEIRNEKKSGLDWETFAQIICGAHATVKFSEDALDAWVNIYYSRKLFQEFGGKKTMRKKNLDDLLDAARIREPKLTNDLWSSICESVDLDESQGLKFCDFLQVYSEDLLGSRHALADWYRIETFRLLPERRAKEAESTKEAVLNIAPEKVNVQEVAEKALEETASTEELFQDLLSQGLEFSKLEKIEDRDLTTEHKFKSGLYATKLSRNKGFLTLDIKSISELTDNLLHKSEQVSDSNDNQKSYDATSGPENELSKLVNANKAEELYAIISLVNENELRPKLRPVEKKTRYIKFKESLFGEKKQDESYDLQPNEHWDDDKTQKIMKEVRDLEKKKQSQKAFAPEVLDEINARIAQLENEIQTMNKVFSSMILRDPSPDAIVRFPDNHFRIFVNLPERNHRRMFLVCKLFKRVGSEKSLLILEQQYATEAVKKATSTYSILKDLVEKQEEHVRHRIAEEHRNQREKLDNHKEIVNEITRLKQKKQELCDFHRELLERQEHLEKVTKNLVELERDEIEQIGGSPVDNNAVEGSSANLVGEQTPAVKEKKRRWRRRKQTKTSETKISFIGQASFELGDLMDVLHEDKAATEDMAVFKNEFNKDVGTLLMQFQYKCASMQNSIEPVPLKNLNENDLPAHPLMNSALYEYPSHSFLRFKWESDPLQKGDRLYLVREEDKFNLSLPYFLLIWNEVANKQRTNGSENDERECDWWMPPILDKFYGESYEKRVQTEDSKGAGTIQLPSSINLSLPPGTYRFILLRNDTDPNTGAKYRSTLGKSSAIAVLPGINGVHTSFGTTPLIDVKPISASLQVLPESEKDRLLLTSSSTKDTTHEGFYDKVYENAIALEQEIEVTRRELRMSNAELIKAKQKDRKLIKEKIARLSMILEDLFTQKFIALEKKRQEENDEAALIAATAASNNSATQVANNKNERVQTTVASKENVVFSYRFEVGAPCAQDRIVILPADVVRTSDFLRATILGKLQGNDESQVEFIRANMERELEEVADFFNMKLSLKKAIQMVGRLIKPYIQGATESDGEQKKGTATVQNESFVWHECMQAFKQAPMAVKKCFPYIIQDLLDEVTARKVQLGLKLENHTVEQSNLQLINSRLMKVGLEIPVSFKQAKARRSSVHVAKAGNEAENVMVMAGEVQARLGFRFPQGGFFIAKYIRRPGAENASAVAGEICRYGPFFLEPALFAFRPRDVAFAIAKFTGKVLKSDQGQLLIKIFAQFYLAAVKYFLAIVSLSFNISVLAGTFSFNVDGIKVLLEEFQDQLREYFGPVQIVLGAIYSFFSALINELMSELQLFEVAGECFTGFFLYGILFFLFMATFIVYVVVQEDLLLKIQKIDKLLPFNPGKMMLGVLEQVGALLVIPSYLSIKSCVLFISRQWYTFYDKLTYTEGGIENDAVWKAFNLTREATEVCPNVGLAQANFGVGISALVLIVIFLFIMLPLLLLDLYSWVPLTELETPEKLDEYAHSYDRLDIKKAVHSNASLVEFRRYDKKRTHKRGYFNFQKHYDDYMELPFRRLIKKYGSLGLFAMFMNVYIHLMFFSMGRALGVFVGWRRRASYMYTNPLHSSESRWKCMDIFCLRFNLAWKVQYIKDKIIMPFINVAYVSFGLWSEDQWREFNVEERANDCYRMEPSGEIKQLQMMTLHGKIVSLFWLCVPKTTLIAYFAEVLNRGPVFSYFMNVQFLQADIPESEREKDPVWRFHSVMAFSGEEDVLYLSDTRFASTAMKWGASIVEIVSLLAVYMNSKENKEVMFAISLISAVVAPVLELNQQIIKAYVDYVETLEDLKNQVIGDKLDTIKSVAQSVQDLKDSAPQGTINLNSRTLRTRRGTGLPRPAGVTGAHQEAAVAGIAATTGTSTGLAGAKGAGAPTASNSNASNLMGLMQLSDPDGITLDVGGDDDFGLEEELAEVEQKIEDQAEAMIDDALEGTILAGAGASLLKPKKQLILLNAMPQLSYVVLTDALDEGEGEITVNWQVNARQRFHALDAIGMFPARAPGDFSIRTMDDCICYRLVKEKNVERFGWQANNVNEDFERDMITRQAKELRSVYEQKISRIAQTTLSINIDNNDENGEENQNQETLKKADKTMQQLMGSPRLKPYKKNMGDILEEEVIQNNLHLSNPRTSRAYSKTAGSLEEAAKKARKTVNGQVKFRPANNCVPEDNKLFESFVYGNNAGIYQSKYGLHGYEFCYLRYNDPSEAKSGSNKNNQNDISKNVVPNAKVTPNEATTPADESKNYEIFERFNSNEIRIGTFNLFMNLTCDQPLVGANQTINLSWIIYGVKYAILSNPKSRNCIGFYRVQDASNDVACSKIEIIPTSAYLKVEANEPVPGRMAVTSPSEPGIYEIRFLFNFFKQAQLHRQCQVFGNLEDQMQQLRIRSFYEKRAVTEEIKRFVMRESKAWGIARMNTFVWLKSMLLSTLREPVKPEVMENTTEYSEFLFTRLKRKLERGRESDSRVYQRRIGQILAPFKLPSFMEVLLVAFSSNSQMSDQLASVSFMSPTDEDLKFKDHNPLRQKLLLAPDQQLALLGSLGFRPLARQFLIQDSLCGYHDFIDDIILNHGQLLLTMDQVMGGLSSACVIQYENVILAAVEEMMQEAKILGWENAMQGIDIMLSDLCRNHIQSLIRAYLETDAGTGLKWKGPNKDARENMGHIVRSTPAGVGLDKVIQFPKGNPPLTIQHVALRRWIRPKLEGKILIIFRQRYSRLFNGNVPILKQMATACFRPQLTLSANPFPNYRTRKTASVCWFLEESKLAAQSERAKQRANLGLDDENNNLVDEEKEEENDEQDDENGGVDEFGADQEEGRDEDEDKRGNDEGTEEAEENDAENPTVEEEEEDPQEIDGSS